MCSNQGYCDAGVNEPSLTACSCFSGFSGAACATAVSDRTSCIESLTATSSEFDTTITGSFNDATGIVTLGITAPIEPTIIDSATEYSTYTLLRFLNQDHCDYPVGDQTTWTETFTAATASSACSESYTGTTNVDNLLGCTGTSNVVCYNSDYTSPGFASCTPSLCVSPPCYRCYPGNVLATRGYNKTSSSGDLWASATAQNCHYFQLCLPWIQDVSDTFQITKVPTFQNDFILTQVAFSCFENLFDPSTCVTSSEHDWLVVIESSTTYPWYVQQVSAGSGALTGGGNTYSLISITDISGCGIPNEQCVQELQYAIPGCNALQTLTTYNIVGLSYNCYGNCSAAKAEVSAANLLVKANVSLQATQDNCGSSLSITASDSITVTFNPFLNDYETANAVFVLDDATLGTAYFKIVATSTVPIVSLSIISLTSTLGSTTSTLTTSEYTVVSCPVAAVVGGTTDICFSVPVSDIWSGTGSNDLVSATLNAELDISYSSKKRSGLDSSYSMQSNIQVVQAAQQSSTQTTTMTGSASALALGSLFVINLF